MDAPLTVIDLLAEPTTHDGKAVSVIGFFIYFKEHVALYPVASRNRTPAQAIHLVHPATVLGERRTKQLTRKWVRLAGTFHNRRRSPAGLFPGEISNITALEPVIPLKTP